MKKYFRSLFLLTALCLASCNKDTTFLISNTQVGKLQKTTTVKSLETVFKTDSLVDLSSTNGNKIRSKRLKVYEKGGKLLLTLTPSTDSIPTIENVRIEDERYLTKNGIGLHSTFKDVQDHYTIKELMTTLNNVVITVKESPIYFSISKQELPANLRFTNQKIEAVQIPDNAKIKYVMVGWQ